MCFREGRVFFASSGEQVPSVTSRLAAAGVVSDKQLRQAHGLMRIQKRDKAERKLGQILIDEGYLESDLLQEFVRGEVADALFDLLRWDEGTLRFEGDEGCPEADIGISCSVDEVMIDANRRLDVWRRIQERIPSLDTCFTIAAAPGANTLDIHLKPREWLLLCHMHGGRSVRELVELSGYGDFETARVLYGMFANGLVERLDDCDEALVG